MLEIFRLAELDDKIDVFIRKLTLEMSDAHSHLLAPILWSLNAFDILPDHLEFAERACKLLSQSRQVTFSGKVLLNQLANSSTDYKSWLQNEEHLASCCYKYD
jgi:hypothetical protein